MIVTDPVCGMAIDPEEAEASTVHKGTTYYFCSEDCQKEFEEDPDAFAERAALNREGVDQT